MTKLDRLMSLAIAAAAVAMVAARAGMRGL